MLAINVKSLQALKPVRTEESEEHKTLYGRAEGCTGEIVSKFYSGGGVACTKCRGWFCY